MFPYCEGRVCTPPFARKQGCIGGKLTLVVMTTEACVMYSVSGWQISSCKCIEVGLHTTRGMSKGRSQVAHVSGRGVAVERLP